MIFLCLLCQSRNLAVFLAWLQYMFSTSAHSAKFKQQLQIACEIVESSSTLKTICKRYQLRHWPATPEVSDCPILWIERRIWADFSLDLFSLGLEYILNNPKEVFWKMQVINMFYKDGIFFKIESAEWNTSSECIKWEKCGHRGNRTFDRNSL